MTHNLYRGRQKFDAVNENKILYWDRIKYIDLENQKYENI